jgi:SAM-dependent methyltransferase
MRRETGGKPMDVELVKKKYRRNARFYDLSEQAFARRRAHAVARLGLQGGEIVLDLACGSGLSFAPLENGIGPSGKIVGVELSPEMLAQAREKVAERGWTNVRLVQANAEEVDLPPASVDAVLAFYAYDVMLSRRAVERAVRALRPGGRFVSAGPRVVPGPRGWLVNPLTRSVARVAAAQPLIVRPWKPLEDVLGPLTVEEHWWGASYLAYGIRSAQGVPAQPAGATRHV